MYYVGVDLHKQTISVCVMIQEKGERRVIGQRRSPVRMSRGSRLLCRAAARFKRSSRRRPATNGSSSSSSPWPNASCWPTPTSCV